MNYFGVAVVSFRDADVVVFLHLSIVTFIAFSLCSVGGFQSPVVLGLVVVVDFQQTRLTAGEALSFFRWNGGTGSD